MPVYEAPEDEDDHGPRQSFNFAPGYNGIVYRADTPDWGAGPRTHKKGEGEAEQEEYEPIEGTEGKETRYKMQTMKWGTSFLPLLSQPWTHKLRPDTILDET
jgi:hypothetical protein